jgi:hypothetical protein
MKNNPKVISSGGDTDSPPDEQVIAPVETHVEVLLCPVVTVGTPLLKRTH